MATTTERKMQAQLRELSGRFPSAIIEIDDGGHAIADPHLMAFLKATANLIDGARLQFETEWDDLVAESLEALQPEFASIVPPMAIVEIQSNDKQATIIRGATIQAKPASGGESCLFRTAYATAVIAARVSHVEYRLSVPRRRELVSAPNHDEWARDALQRGRTSLEVTITPNGSCQTADLGHTQRLRVFLAAPDQSFAFRAHESMFQSRCGVLAATGNAESWHRAHVAPVGFGRDELILPAGRGTLDRQRLVEYFAFPQKFLFFDFLIPPNVLESLKERAPLRFMLLFDRDLPELATLTADDLRLNCTPVVNLFDAAAQPIRLETGKTEYPLIVDPRRSGDVEIYAVRAVQEVEIESNRRADCRPQYGGRYQYDGGKGRFAWRVVRVDPADLGSREFEQQGRQSWRSQLLITDEAFTPARAVEGYRLEPRVTCTNGDLATTLSAGTPLTVETGEPLVGRLVTRPTAALRPPSRRDSRHHFRLHLASPRLSLARGAEGAGRLQTALRQFALEDWRPSERYIKSEARHRTTVQVIAGITSVSARTTLNGNYQIAIELDETLMPYGCSWLFAAVLRQYLRDSAAIGLPPRVRVRNMSELLKPWARAIPRARQLSAASVENVEANEKL